MKTKTLPVCLLSLLLTASRLVAQTSTLGSWDDDAQGLPIFKFTAGLPLRTQDAAGASYPLPADPFFLIGNYRIKLFTHVSGLYELMTGERSWARVNAGDRERGDNAATLAITRGGATARFELAGPDSLAADASRCRRVFGTGYARWDFDLGGGMVCSRVLSVPPSPRINAGSPAFVVSVRVSNTGAEPVQVGYTEAVLAHYVAVLDRLKPEGDRLVTYTNRVKLDQANGLAQADILAQSKDPSVFRSRDYACRYDGYPPSLVLQLVPSAPGAVRSRVGSTPEAPGRDRLSAQAEFELRPGETREVNLVIGLAFDQQADQVLALGRSLAPSADGAYFRADWKRQLPNLQREKDVTFRREMVWDAHALEAMATYSAFYGETYVPQGMTYDFEMDLTAAARDHLQHSLPLCYTHPELAKSCLRFVLKKMTSQGEIAYTDYGFGKTSNGAWNTSDQQLYLFLTIAEYLRITGDVGFLLERTQFLPTEANYTGTTLDKLDRAFMYLRDEIGTGTHGLISLRNSDWNDLVFSDKSVLRYFWTGESHMNSTMAMAVLPRLMEQLDRASRAPQLAAERDRLGRLHSALQRYDALVREAFYRDLGARTFSQRLYYDHATPLGEDTMYLEPQAFLLQATDFPVARKQVLLAEIRRRLLAGEVEGPRQRETPLQSDMMQGGTGENGGFWWALSGPLVLGVATFDQPAAYDLLRQMTFANFTRHYPGYWVGQWTAPDTLNASTSGAIAGLPRPGGWGDGQNWSSFGAYCAHAHAWPLYCYYRLGELRSP